MTAAHARPPVIGLDLGGTKNAAALVGGGGTVLVGGGGTVLARHARPTPAREGAEAVLDAPAEAARAVRAPDATAIGVAAAGVIDPVTGTVTSATDTIHGWAGTALATGLADRTGLPVACDNDVRATATTELPEDRPGAGATLVYAAVGTGVGGAVAVGGRVLHGAAGVAGHLGHLPSPEADGLPCTCGATGHLEAIAAGPAITAHYTRRADRDAGPGRRGAGGGGAQCRRGHGHHRADRTHQGFRGGPARLRAGLPRRAVRPGCVWWCRLGGGSGAGGWLRPRGRRRGRRR